MHTEPDDQEMADRDMQELFGSREIRFTSPPIEAQACDSIVHPASFLKMKTVSMQSISGNIFGKLCLITPDAYLALFARFLYLDSIEQTKLVQDEATSSFVLINQMQGVSWITCPKLRQMYKLGAHAAKHVDGSCTADHQEFVAFTSIEKSFDRYAHLGRLCDNGDFIPMYTDLGDEIILAVPDPKLFLVTKVLQFITGMRAHLLLQPLELYLKGAGRWEEWLENPGRGDDPAGMRALYLSHGLEVPEEFRETQSEDVSSEGKEWSWLTSAIQSGDVLSGEKEWPWLTD